MNPFGLDHAGVDRGGPNPAQTSSLASDRVTASTRECLIVSIAVACGEAAESSGTGFVRFGGIAAVAAAGTPGQCYDYQGNGSLGACPRIRLSLT